MRNKSLPWIEQYRPTKLDEVIGQRHIVNRLKHMVEAIQNGDRNMPHMMFVGDAGIGKTTCAEALAKDAFGSSWKSNWIELNASDERGIDVVRTKIKAFGQSARLPHPTLGKVFNLIFLDEADMLTPEAQAALRRPMEKYSNTCRFILSVNNSNRVIQPIQNRCQVFRFHPLTENEITDALIEICSGESIEIADAAMWRLAEVANGSMRKALNLLYTLSLQSDMIKVEDIDELIDYVPMDKIKEIFKAAAKGEIEKCDKLVDNLYWTGFSPQEILSKTFDYVRLSDKINRSSKIKLIVRMSQTENYIIVGSNPLFQLKCFFAWLAEKSQS